MLVQTEDKEYSRDINTMALTNTNKNELYKYKEQKRRIEETATLKCELSQLKEEFSEIKSLLLELVKQND